MYAITATAVSGQPVSIGSQRAEFSIAGADVGGEVSEEDAAWPAPSETTASDAEESAPPMSALSAGNIAAAPSDVNITTVDAIPATSRTQEAASLPSCLEATGSDKVCIQTIYMGRRALVEVSCIATWVGHINVPAGS